MNSIKQLAGQTLVYGMGTIVPRVLNYALLTPFYTRIFPVETGEYGVVTEIYAYMAILLILLTYGMETAFFRFSTSKELDKKKVYNTALLSLLTSSILFLVIVLFNNQGIANILEYSGHKEYIIMFSIIVAIDAFTAIPFARLRIENKAFRFAFIKLINVLVIVIIAFGFLYWIPQQIEKNPDSILNTIYSPEIRVGYVFIANLCGSLVSLILLLPNIITLRFKADFTILKKLLAYALPLLIAGLAGVLNDNFDKAAMKFLIPDKTIALKELAIYGANYKIAVLMALFIQMFRYAAEPFFFSKSKDKNATKLYAQVMNYFVLFCLVIFLVLSLNLEIFKYLIPPDYWNALNVVPIILMAFVFFGIFVNLSVWYKLNDLTKYAVFITLAGTVVTLFINIKYVPVYGYMASAWGHFAAYLLMIVMSYFLGKKHYPVPYNILKIGYYFIITLAIFLVCSILPIKSNLLHLIINNVLILIFVGFIYFKELKHGFIEVDNL
ncbi:MAG: oligosaccharide flippase family protein [Bacteroidales bacterium]|nr:oligosaccharide flippase family protein [Bacteroidales bacterium]